MKTIYIVSILFCFGTVNTISGQNNSIVNFNNVYRFINSTMTNDTIKFNLSNSPIFYLDEIDTTAIFSDTLFTEEDIVCFRQQFLIAENVNWEHGKIIGANVISHRKLNKIFNRKNGWDKFRKKYGNCLTSFSLPIFNKVNTYCIFYYWTQCDYLAGGGRLNLYKLENNKWIFVKNYLIGVS